MLRRSSFQLFLIVHFVEEIQVNNETTNIFLRRKLTINLFYIRILYNIIINLLTCQVNRVSYV